MTSALPSSKNGITGRARNLRTIASEASAVTEAIERLTRIPVPNTQTYATIAGINASSTFSMTMLTLVFSTT